MARKSKGKKSVFSLIISVLSYIMLAIALLIFASVTVSRVKGEIPSVLGMSLHVVATPSMQTGEDDSIDVGTVVFVKKCDYSDVKVEDIILFEPTPHQQIETPSGVINVDKVLHRVKSIDQNSGIITATKGDANVNEDSFAVKTVYGKMIGQSKFLGSIVTFILQPKSVNILFGVAAVALLLVIVGIVIKIIYNFKNPEEKELTVEEQKEAIRQEIEQRLRAEMSGAVQQKTNADDGQNGQSQPTHEGESSREKVKKTRKQTQD